jgi:hypothetical protein
MNSRPPGVLTLWRRIRSNRLPTFSNRVFTCDRNSQKRPITTTAGQSNALMKSRVISGALIGRRRSSQHAEMLAIGSLLDPPVPSAGVARAEDVEMLASVKRAG